ncbi:hypothetical protein EL26_21685 [Tumebacillus flagellatus]|uniref:HTH cro/C1-type domain-containing protein n=1 Tax=Tumebacillus flagellatus TaxID=1157490 RepID=A0A074LGD5_9BACL|nr:hypothetical protein EL26_21685 [Tumebacillus flagellatus]
MDTHGIKQKTVVEESGVSSVTLTKLCNVDLPKNKIIRSTAVKIVDALARLTGEPVKIEDFWA